MAKPVGADFTWANDANFSSGPASGNPTKISPAGWPTNLQGFIPGLVYASEFRNWLFNKLGLWTGWLQAGSSAGAADAHIVETDASGNTKLRDLSLVDPTGSVLQFDNGAGAAAGGNILCATPPGTGALPGGELTILAQAGQSQSGGATNNNGGPLTLGLGVKGLGGSGTGGQGFGGAALDGPLMVEGSNQARVRLYMEGYTLAAAAAATKVMNIMIENDKQSVLAEIKLVTVENGGGTGLDSGTRTVSYRIRREGTTLDISSAIGDSENEVYSGTGPAITVTDPADGSFNVNVSGAQNETTAGVLYVWVYASKVSS